MLLRSLLAVVPVSLAACVPHAAVVGPVVEPRSVAVQLGAQGPLAPVRLKLASCDAISAELRFQRRAFSSEAELRQLIGGPGKPDANGRYAQPGTPIKLRISVKRVEKSMFGADRLADAQVFELTTQGTGGGGIDHVRREVGLTTLPSGEYQVDALLVEAVPALQHVETELVIGSNSRVGPQPDKCS